MRPPHDSPLPWQVLGWVCLMQHVPDRAGGGAPPLGITPVHTSRCPQAGQRSVHVAPLGTGCLPIEGDRHDYGRLASLRPATR